MIYYSLIFFFFIKYLDIVMRIQQPSTKDLNLMSRCKHHNNFKIKVICFYVTINF